MASGLRRGGLSGAGAGGAGARRRGVGASHGRSGVGTPVVVFQPPDGLAFFGPVISRIPDDADALRLWDAGVTWRDIETSSRI